MAHAVEQFKVKAIERARHEADQEDAGEAARPPPSAGAKCIGLPDGFESRRRQHRHRGLAPVERARGRGRHAHQQCRHHATAVRRRRGRLAGSFGQRTVGCQRNARADRFGIRDQPARAGIEPHCHRCRPSGQPDRQSHRRAVEGSHPHRQRGQAHHRYRQADQLAGAQCHHRGRPRGRSRQRIRSRGGGSEDACHPDREGDRRDRRADRRDAGRDRGMRSRRSRRSAATIGRICGDRDCRSRPRWRSRARPPARSPATWTMRPRSAARVAANIGDVNRAASETGAASGRVLASAQVAFRRRRRHQGRGREFLATVRAA